MKLVFKVVFLAIIFGVISGVLTTLTILEIQTPSKEKLMEEFYLTENLIHVSPHSLRKAIDRNDNSFILVDLRSQEEYEEEHIIGAINIPAYRNPDESAYDEIDRIVSEFSKLPKNKDIIIYCYSIPCMTGRKIGKVLAEQGIYVKLLGIGWNEWKYYWDLWNHEHEWNITNVRDYITKGKEIKTLNSAGGCDSEWEFSC
jgi:rhodanese-related sulfurtransferase